MVLVLVNKLKLLYSDLLNDKRAFLRLQIQKCKTGDHHFGKQTVSKISSSIKEQTHHIIFTHL